MRNPPLKDTSPLSRSLLDSDAKALIGALMHLVATPLTIFQDGGLQIATSRSFCWHVLTFAISKY